MGSKVVLLSLLFIWCFCEHHVGVEARKLSREEDLELEKQLKLLNKPANTTILTIYEETYDCVDFYKQPAFDHPNLKSHNFHPEMSSLLYNHERSFEDSSINDELPFGKIWKNGKGCPVGTVPIRRTTKDDLIRAKLAADIYDTVGEPGTHYAVLRTNPDEKKYHGGGMYATTHTPTAWGSQYSSAQIKIQNGPDSIEAGWTVNPSLYQENRTRLFIYTRAGASHCFNTFCPGFVIVRPDLPIDHLLRVSQPGEPIYYSIYHLSREATTGNWWVEFGIHRTRVGFWSPKIFTGLANPATSIEWGGKVYSSPVVPSPAMGSRSIRIHGDMNYDAFFNKVVTINESGQVVDAVDTSTYNDIPEYVVIDKGIVDSDLGHQFFYGGGGGYTGN